MRKVRARPGMRSALLLVVLVALLAVSTATAPGAGAVEPTGGRRADRVVIVSIPTLTWELVAEEQPPALTDLLERSAVASASVRTIGVDTSLGEAYGTIGAGNRVAVDDELAGLTFGVDEVVGSDRAGDVLARRSGEPVGDAALVHLGAPALEVLNDRLLYGAVPGALGTAVSEAGGEAVLVANADREAPVDEEERDDGAHREAGLAVMDVDGRIAGGTAGAELLEADPAAPFGVRLDEGAVLAAFDSVADADVVLVELSDLDRADAFRAVATRDAARAARREALAATDALLAALVDRIDLARDLVVVIAPTAPRGPSQLVVAALAGPGIEPGLAQSGTTGRAGYVTLPDVAPTVLSALAIDQPGSMNGALMDAAGGGAPGPSTWRDLAADNVRALFRNAVSGPLTVVFIILVVIGLALAAFTLSGRGARLRPLASFLQLVALATPLVTYLAGLVREDRLGVPASIVAILVAAGVLAALARLVGQAAARGDTATRAFAPPLLLLAATAFVLLVDVFVGAPLQLDTAFGYGGGAIVAGRFTGYGNLAGGLLTLAVIATATGVWSLVQLRRGGGERPSSVAVGAIAALFVFTVVVTGLPGLGRDVGGVLAIVPGFVLVVALLTGVRVSWYRALLVGLGTVVVLGVFGAVDLARPAAERGHLGRLIDQTLGDEGTGGLLTVIERKINANLSILSSSVWSMVIPVAVAFLAFLVWRPPRIMDQLLRLPGMRAFLVGSLATCALAAVLNDSGIAIPGIMLTLLLPYVAHLALELHAESGSVLVASSPRP